MSKSSLEYKEAGNKFFTKGEYASAEASYSQAILGDPKNHVLYSNRAIARIRLGQYDNAVSDCWECIRLKPDHMKAYYSLAQACLSLHRYEEAVDHALTAHQLVYDTLAVKDLESTTTLVLKCKKARWDDREKRRKRETAELEDEVVALLERERDRLLSIQRSEGDDGAPGEAVDDEELRQEWKSKIEQVREIFERARPSEEKKRVVPDWAIDEISFQFMVDPVITKTGRSYERASLMKYWKDNPVDPVTKEDLPFHEIRSNITLRQACEDFLEKNGWAADY